MKWDEKKWRTENSMLQLCHYSSLILTHVQSIKSLFFLFKNLAMNILQIFWGGLTVQWVLQCQHIPTPQRFPGRPDSSTYHHVSFTGWDAIKTHTAQSAISQKLHTEVEIGRRPKQPTVRAGNAALWSERAPADHPPRFAFQSVSRWFPGVDQRDFHPLPKRRIAFFFFSPKGNSLKTSGVRCISTGRLGHRTKLLCLTFRLRTPTAPPSTLSTWLWKRTCRPGLPSVLWTTLKTFTSRPLRSFQKISTYPKYIWGGHSEWTYWHKLECS